MPATSHQDWDALDRAINHLGATFVQERLDEERKKDKAERRGEIASEREYRRERDVIGDKRAEREAQDRAQDRYERKIADMNRDKLSREATIRAGDLAQEESKARNARLDLEAQADIAKANRKSDIDERRLALDEDAKKSGTVKMQFNTDGVIRSYDGPEAGAKSWEADILSRFPNAKGVEKFNADDFNEVAISVGDPRKGTVRGKIHVPRSGGIQAVQDVMQREWGLKQPGGGMPAAPAEQPPKASASYDMRSGINYESIPKGASYIDPNGKSRVKSQ